MGRSSWARAAKVFLPSVVLMGVSMHISNRITAATTNANHLDDTLHRIPDAVKLDNILAHINMSLIRLQS